jgi:hypothetical protein
VVYLNTACAALTDGTVSCWRVHKRIVRPLAGITAATALSIGGSHVCALEADGDAHCGREDVNGDRAVSSVPPGSTSRIKRRSSSRCR